LSSSGAASAQRPVEKIVVRVRVGSDLMAASDDPLFLRLGGPSGREFRLRLAKGKSLRRGQEDRFVLGAPDDPETNVDQPQLNDPGSPPLDLLGIDHAWLVKGMEPLPNVRGFGEMDDRLLLEEVEVQVHAKGGPPARFRREGPHWLGLVCGLSLELARADDGA
jgi:hypothetical protein